MPSAKLKKANAKVRGLKIVIRGFTYRPKGKRVDRRVEVGADVPADMTEPQVTRLMKRGVVGWRSAAAAADKDMTNG